MAKTPMAIVNSLPAGAGHVRGIVDVTDSTLSGSAGYAAAPVAVNSLRTLIVALQQTVAELGGDIDGLQYLRYVTHNAENGVLTITRQDNTTLTVQIPGLVADAELVESDLIITFQGGGTVTIPLGTLVPLIAGSMGDQIQITYNVMTGEIGGILRLGTVLGTHLANNIVLPSNATATTPLSTMDVSNRVATTEFVHNVSDEYADHVMSNVEALTDQHAAAFAGLYTPGQT